MRKFKDRFLIGAFDSSTMIIGRKTKLFADAGMWINLLVGYVEIVFLVLPLFAVK